MANSANVAVRVAEGHDKREKGNELFKAGEQKKAMRQYHEGLLCVKGLELVGYGPTLSEEDKTTISGAIVALTNNLAACHVKTKNWVRVMELTNAVLEKEPRQCKALFRRGQAYYYGEGNLDRALEDFKTVIEIDPTDTQANSHYDKINALIAGKQRMTDDLFKEKFGKAFNE